jgi:hypothetical protein
MKYIKYIVITFIVINLLTSCSNDSDETLDLLSKKGIYTEQININEDSNKSQGTVEHSIAIVDNKFNEYIDGHLIAEIPFEQVGNKLVILKPNSNEILTELILNDDGSLTNPQNITYQFVEGNINISEQTEKSMPRPRQICQVMCIATHRFLGVPRWLDSICCFWYNGEV